jgi:hypothetical protein
MVTRNKKTASEKKKRVKVGKLEATKELSASKKKEVRGGETKVAPGGENVLAQAQNAAMSLFK